MTVAEAVADWLASEGVTHGFGIIGAGNLPIWEAISKRGATELICVHHEQAAVMAAGYFQRTSGRIALALVTTGAGSANAITGAMAAWMDSTPVLIVSGNEPYNDLMRDSRRPDCRVKGVQGYRSADLAESFTNASFQVPRYTDDQRDYGLSALLGRAYQTAHGRVFAKRPGPVWIDLSRDVANAVVR